MTALSPSLPALAEALPADPAASPESLLPAHPGAEPVPTSAEWRESAFTRERQVEFLHALAACGAVRNASAAIGISYRTAYRERRASPAFRRAWDAALLSARALSEDVLACRAIDGIEEQVLYHGEVVATRRRYDARLLLAHLARLDKLTEDARTRAFADDYEGALERFAAGIDDPAPVCPDCGEALPMAPSSPDSGPDAEGEISSPGQCDKCDMPSAKAAAARAEAREATAQAIRPCPDCGGRCLGPAWKLTVTDCQSHVRRLWRMEDARPTGAKEPDEFPGHDQCDVEEEQLAAFEAGVDEWWRVVPPGPDDDPDEWCFAE